MFEYLEKWKNPKTGRYKKHVYLMDGKQMTGVTTVLGMIAKPALIQWAADMAIKYLKENTLTLKDYLERLETTPKIEITNIDIIDEGYRVVGEKFLEDARTYHIDIKESAGDKGTDTHALVEEYVKMCIINGGSAIDQKTKEPMLAKFIQWSVDNKVTFLESEKKVYSKTWFVGGTADFTCVINEKRYVGDLKTMKKMWDRTPFFQAAAYMKMLVEMGEENYDGSVIVNINKETNELTEFYSYDFEQDQKCFEAALTLYRNIDL